MPTKQELQMLQALPLDLKIMRTQQRIREWVQYYGTDGVCVSFSGGKDSTVLLHLVRQMYPNIKAVFSDTGLEYPEIRNFVKSIDNVDWVKPKQSFHQIVLECGYPLFSKEISEAIRYARKIGGGWTIRVRKKFLGQCYKRERNCKTTELPQEKVAGFLQGQEDGDKSIFNKEKYLPACQELPFLIGGQCCNKMKKTPLSQYQKENRMAAIVGTTAEESMLRLQGWLRTGCNAFKKGKSQPLSFWKEQDILTYIKQNNIKISSIYGDIVSIDKSGGYYEQTLCEAGKLKCTKCSRTGCMYCAFGAANEHKKLGKSRYELLAEIHPQIYDYCMRGGEWADNPYYDETAPLYDNDGWKNWNPKKIWQPSASGLGLKYVFQKVNEIYGKDFIKYE